MQRVLKTIELELPDRPPLDGWFLKSVMDKLKNHFKVQTTVDVFKNLGIDFLPTCMLPGKNFRKGASYFSKMGASIQIADYFVRKYSENELEDEWGTRIKITGDSDLSWRYSYHPLNKYGKLSIDNLKLPKLKDASRFDKVKEDIEKYKNKFVICAGVTTLFRKGWILSGYSKFLETLYLDNKFINKLLDILEEYITEEVEKYISEEVDIIQFGGDLGTEQTMMLSPDMWREIFKPRFRNIINKTKKKGVYFYLHSDGNIQPIIADLIEIGIDILNPIQPECMEPEKIKQEYGDKITLHGTMSLQKTFTQGKKNDIKEEVLKRIKTCGYNGGLILSPSNAFTEDVSISNILYFYDLVRNIDLDNFLMHF
jgi:uroporphyrinogen decarboxylase